MESPIIVCSHQNDRRVDNAEDALPKGEYQEYLRLVCAEGPAGYPPEPAE